VADAFTPWVSALDEGLGSGEYEWVLGADGALVPTPVAADGARIRPKRRWWSRSSQ
jgi:hypothetical protein